MAGAAALLEELSFLLQIALCIKIKSDSNFFYIPKKAILILADGRTATDIILVPMLSLSSNPSGGCCGRRGSVKPAVVYSVQWEAEWVQIRFCHSEDTESGLLA